MKLTSMLMIKVATVWTMVLLASCATAQGRLTRESIELSQAGQHEKALEKIESAIASGERMDPLTWYVKAYVLKSIFVEREGRNPDSQLRTESIAAAMESARLDPEGRIAERREPLLSFLADTHLEDANHALAMSQPGDAHWSRDHFEAYVRINQHLQPNWDATPDAVLLEQQLAEYAFVQAETHEQSQAGPWFKWGQVCYQNAIALGHDAFRSEYNLAVHTYNQGVRQFKAAEDDLEAVDTALKMAAVLWTEAAAGLESAIALDPKQRNGYEALTIVSEALLNQDRIAWCKANLAELGKR